MSRTLLALVVLGSGCASSSDSIEVTVAGDGKSDSLAGKTFDWDVGDNIFNWYRDRTGTTVPEHAVTVRYRAEDKLALRGPLVYFDPWGTDEPNFGSEDILEVKVVNLGRPAKLAFVMFDYNAYWSSQSSATVKPYTCPTEGSPTSLFTTVAFDFRREEITIDGARTMTFAECGVDIESAAESEAGRWALGTLVTPVEDSAGDFAGTYNYRFDVAVK